MAIAGVHKVPPFDDDDKRTIAGSFESDNSVYVSYYINDTSEENLAKYGFKLDDQEVTPGFVGGKYQLTVQGVSADLLGVPHKFTMYRKADGQEWNVEVSVLTYARTSISKESTEPLRADLGRALYLYYLAAHNYFND